MEKVLVGGYMPASFLDWDGHVTAVIFTNGCNFRCPYCHNSGLVKSETDMEELDAVLKDIKRRAAFLDGVTISGGEPCMWPHLLSTMREIKKMGLEIKLDTNGSFYEVLKSVLDEGLADHVAMDVKAPLEDEALERITKNGIGAERLSRSIELIKSKAPSYEFRTTFSPSYLSEAELLKIREDLSDDSHWIVQCFKPNNCLDEEFLELKAVDEEYVKKLVPGVKVRG